MRFGATHTLFMPCVGGVAAHLRRQHRFHKLIQANGVLFAQSAWARDNVALPIPLAPSATIVRVKRLPKLDLVSRRPLTARRFYSLNLLCLCVCMFVPSQVLPDAPPVACLPSIFHYAPLSLFPSAAPTAPRPVIPSSSRGDRFRLDFDKPRRLVHTAPSNGPGAGEDEPDAGPVEAEKL